jgi:hypothetical protein
MASDRTHDVVRLATAATSAQAHIWQQALEEEGISCKVVGDFLDAGFGALPGISAEIWVHRDDLAKAQEVLARPELSSEATDEDADVEEPPETPGP